MIVTCECCNRRYMNEKDLLDRTACFKICSDNNLWFECSCHSCLMIPEGKYDWYRPEHFMSSRTKSVFKSIADLKKIPRLPSDIMRIQKLLCKEDVDARMLEKEIKKIPPVALSIIEIADSMAAKEITSLQHAISYVGLVKLKETIRLAGIRSCEFATPAFDQEEFWKDSYISGIIAEYVAKKLVPANPAVAEQAYFTASLANIGKLVSAFIFPAILEKVTADISMPGCRYTWSELEEHYGLPDHAILGEIAGVMWGLPFYTIRTIRFHNSCPEDFREDSRGDVVMFGNQDFPEEEDEGASLHDLVCLSLQYTHWVLGAPERINQDVFDSFLRKMSLDEKAKDDLGSELSGYYQTVK